ncbi:hypothetical protein BDP27DRAFT_840061 [Rhodocollybia butyracea]|uniref:Secreted protein n=1 Tax=Rhodocollybia butyracea TaxID=206335 RepID=A0A9P5PS34_9AGAR|nr:hypothetical protein BDP27DRAFT_840061 [Rhodocollybia butyracea]
MCSLVYSRLYGCLLLLLKTSVLAATSSSFLSILACNSPCLATTVTSQLTSKTKTENVPSVHSSSTPLHGALAHLQPTVAPSRKVPRRSYRYHSALHHCSRYLCEAYESPCAGGSRVSYGG